ncbi:MAG: PilT/PilU family type 4a pilus ATPase [Candidatus Brocadiae bacterium]|nr:PilT/PilU family type 4a pilus ATPase [Candidatus Brocadiia bacterium]
MERIVDNALNHMIQAGASDLFLSTNNFPAMRVQGEVKFFLGENLTSETTSKIFEELTGMTTQECFMQKTDMDLAYSSSIGRFRVNIFMQNGKLGFVFRHIPSQIPTMEELHLPVAILQKLAALHRGLVLVTGITGSGKSTTLASIIQYINQNMQRHIVTIEDPVEFIYDRKSCLINQREIGRDAPNFGIALRSAMRQSPDVILIGEMRDTETVESALQAAETGHLVLSTLHTLNATQTVERILAFFPPHQHELIRMQMSLILEGVISQRLVKKSDNSGRVPAIEIMLATPTIKELLEQGKTRSLDKAVNDGGHFGCQTFNQSLADLVNKRLITKEDALKYADNPDQLKMIFRGITQSSQISKSPMLGESPSAKDTTRIPAVPLENTAQEDRLSKLQDPLERTRRKLAALTPNSPQTKPEIAPVSPKPFGRPKEDLFRHPTPIIPQPNNSPLEKKSDTNGGNG